MPHRSFLFVDCGIATNPKKNLFLACSNVSGEDAVACAAPTRRKPQLRRTRTALARSERPSERHCTLNVGAPPRARCISSCFLRDEKIVDSVRLDNFRFCKFF